MKKNFLILVLVFAAVWVWAQPPKKPPFDVGQTYDRPYTFEVAKRLEWDWEFDKAIWYYINLVPEDLKTAAERIKKLKNHIGNPIIFINTTFKIFIVYDPEVNYMQNDTLVTKKDVYLVKREWADKLIQEVSK